MADEQDRAPNNPEIVSRRLSKSRHTESLSLRGPLGIAAPGRKVASYETVGGFVQITIAGW
jgi:hypothetical protein